VLTSGIDAPTLTCAELLGVPRRAFVYSAAPSTLHTDDLYCWQLVLLTVPLCAQPRRTTYTTVEAAPAGLALPELDFVLFA
jgi:hypothetical protein